MTPSHSFRYQNKTDGCFPGDAQVELQGGAMMAMSALKVGDVVRVGAATYSKVYMFTHKDAEVKAKFTKIFTSTGKTLRLTSGHYLYVWCTKLPPIHFGFRKVENTDGVRRPPFYGVHRTRLEGGGGGSEPIEGGFGTPRQCSLGSVASYLCHFMLTCGLHILMNHHISKGM